MAAANTFNVLKPLFKEKYSTEKIIATPPKFPKKVQFPRIIKVMKY